MAERYIYIIMIWLLPSLSALRSLRESFVTDPPPQREMEHRKIPVLRGKASIPLFPAKLTNISSFSAIQISLRLMRSYECDGLRNPDLSPAADRWQDRRVLPRKPREKRDKETSICHGVLWVSWHGIGPRSIRGKESGKETKVSGKWEKQMEVVAAWQWVPNGRRGRELRGGNIRKDRKRRHRRKRQEYKKISTLDLVTKGGDFYDDDRYYGRKTTAKEAIICLFLTHTDTKFMFQLFSSNFSLKK